MEQKTKPLQINFTKEEKIILEEVRKKYGL